MPLGFVTQRQNSGSLSGPALLHNMIMTLRIVTNLTLNRTLKVIRNAGPDSAPGLCKWSGQY